MLARAYTPSESKGVRFKIFSDRSLWCQPTLRVEALWIREELRIATNRPVYITNKKKVRILSSQMVVSETIRNEELDVPDIAYNTCTFRYAIIFLENARLLIYRHGRNTPTHPYDIFGCFVCETYRGQDTSEICDQG